jgi:hypothetical protein
MNTLKFYQTEYIPCAVCRNPFTIEHYIIPIELFGEETNENRIYLCSNHHRIVRFLMDLEDIYGINKTRMTLIQKEKYYLLEKYIKENESLIYNLYHKIFRGKLLAHKNVYFQKLEQRKRELLELQNKIQAEKDAKYILGLFYNVVDSFLKIKIKKPETKEEAQMYIDTISGMNKVLSITCQIFDVDDAFNGVIESSNGICDDLQYMIDNNSF